MIERNFTENDGKEPLESQFPMNDLVKVFHERLKYSEIKLRIDKTGTARLLLTQSVIPGTHLERLCREYSNQDIVVKIRHGKKIEIEQTRIIILDK